MTPQVILAGPASGNVTMTAGAMPVQQLLIPVSTGNGTQQMLISIPLSLAAGSGNQIQLLTTSGGQLIATNLAGFGQPLNLSQPGEMLVMNADGKMNRFLAGGTV